MRPLRSFPLCVVLAVLLSGAAAIAQQALVSSRITNPIDEKQLVTIKGTVHPLANAGNDRGAAPDEMRLDRIHLLLQRSSSQETALRQLISDMHTPGTASYHKWLTPDAFGKQFGPSDEDIATVETWLSGHGFNVAKVTPGKQVIEFSGNVGQFRSAFHTQVHKYAVNGETHFANAADPQIPAALAPVVGGFAALNNFSPKSYAKYLGKAQYDPKTDHATPEWTVGSPTNGYSFVLSPGDYAVQYDLTPLYSAGVKGAGQSIAIINVSNINIELVNNFRKMFGLSVNPPQVIIDGNDPGVDGVNNPDGPNGASVEAYLDVEWAGAVAPDATVDLVIGGDTAMESGLFLAAEHAVYGNVAPVISLSFGQCESSLAGSAGFLNNLWEQAAAQGITVMVSAGDSGSAGCDGDNSEYATQGQAVSGYASTPYNVAVGGTDFYYSDYSQGLAAMEGQFGTYWNTAASNTTPAVSIKGVIPEQPWNNSQYGKTISTLINGAQPTSTTIGAGGGGSSLLYTTKPAWQTGFGDTARDLPDVSLFASNGSNATYIPICAVDGDCQTASAGESIQFSGVGGTSASSPSFAGIMALVNQKYGPQGQADFVLYPLSKQFPAAFNDVANGTNSVPCESGTINCIPVTPGVTIIDGNGDSILEGQIGTGTTPWYNATAGYDEASGLGTVDANQLITDWNKVTFTKTTTTLTPSSTSFTHGTAITVSGDVTAGSGTPTGNVALMTSSTEPDNQGSGLASFVNGDPSTFPLSGGAYTGLVSTLPGGTYNIWGQYSGDATNAAGSSTPVSITVAPESSGIYLSLISPTGTFNSSNPPGTTVDYGTQLNLSAIVTSSSANGCLTAGAGCSGYAPATGTVVFSDNSKPLDTATINTEGDAEYNAPFAIGSHSVSASYAGDNSYKASTASAIQFTVTQDTPNIFVGASNETNDTQEFQFVGGTGQPTVFNVLVENGQQSTDVGFRVPVKAPTGTISVTGFPSGVPTSATLSAGLDPSTGAVAGIATITLPASTPTGDYTVKISYSGDTNYAAVPAESGTIEIVSAGLTATSTTATVSGSISPTSSILIKGSVTGSGSTAPTGEVFVYSSGSVVAATGLSPGSGDASTFSFVLNSQSLSPGVNFVTLQYVGDAHYAPSAFTLSSPISNPLSDFTLVPASTIVAVSAPGDAGTIPITVTSVNGYSGQIALAGSANAAIGVQIPASVTLTAGSSQTINVTLTSASSLGSGNFDVGLSATDTQGHEHTLGLELNVGGSIAPSPSFALSNSGSIAVSPGATTGNTSTISVTPSNGFTGAVTLSCLITNPPGGITAPTCTIPGSVSITGTAAATTALTIDSTASTTPGAYTFTVTGVSGSITQSTAVSVTINAAPTFNMSNNGPISVTQGSTGTAAVTVTPTTGFTGTVNLTCAVTTSPAGASSPVTCSLNPPAADITGASAVTSTVTVVSTDTTTTGAYVVTVTGTDGSLTQTSLVNVTVNTAAAATYALTNSGNITINPGSITGNTTLVTITGSNGFTGTVNLTCAITPTAASDPATCILAASSASVSPTVIPSVVVTVNSTAATTGKNDMKKLFWPSAGGATVALLLFFGLPKRRRNWLAMLGLLVVLVAAAGIGCGGVNNTGGGGGNTGTTPGTYTLTVTGTSGSITQTTTATLTIN